MATPIAVTAEKRLRESPYPSLRMVSCIDKGGILILRGHVPNFFHKQLAQTAVANIDGVKELVNQIEVTDGG
jgi:osmotically-inducible protein OsmY